MSRLKRRIASMQPQPLDIPEGYEAVEYPVDNQQNPEEQYQQSPLIQEYDLLQRKAQDYKREVQATEATNPHTLYKEIVTNHSPKHKYEVTLMGRPIDMSLLENYLIYKVSPKTTVTLMKFNEGKILEEIKGFSKRKPIKIKGGAIMIIIGAIILLVIGLVILTQGSNMSSMFQGMFGI